MILYQVCIVQGAAFRLLRSWSPSCCCLPQDSSSASWRRQLYMCYFVFLLYFLSAEMSNHCLSLHILCITLLCLEKLGLLKWELSAHLDQKTDLPYQLHFASITCSQPVPWLLWAHPVPGTCGGFIRHLKCTSKTSLHLVDSYHLQISEPLPEWSRSPLRPDFLKCFHHSVCVLLPSPSTLDQANDSYSEYGYQVTEAILCLEVYSQ